ncbi:MAG: formate/nitrite transporter family protein [Terriglobia bacterium]
MADRRAKSKPEQAQKSYEKILQQETTEGLKEIERPSLGLFISGLSAGLDLTFSLILMATMMTLIHHTLPAPVTEILVADMYSVGFIFVVLGRSELFTEHTTRAFYPVFTGYASVGSLLRLWGLIYAGNIIGSAAFAKLVTVIGPALGIINPAVFGEIGRQVVGHSWWVIGLSAVLAGWLMGLLSWLVTAGRDTISQVFFVWLITFALGFCHFHHAILGNSETLAAVFTGSVSPGQYGFSLLWSTVGNAVGGGVFVALLKYSHVMYGGDEPDPVVLTKAGEISQSEDQLSG